MSEFEPWRDRETSMCTTWKETSWTMLDKLHLIRERFTERRMERRQKETAREPRKVESSMVENKESLGKEKVKERKDDVSTKSQNHKKNSGQADLGSNGLNNLGAQKPTLRVGVTMIGTL